MRVEVGLMNSVASSYAPLRVTLLGALVLVEKTQTREATGLSCSIRNDILMPDSHCIG